MSEKEIAYMMSAIAGIQADVLGLREDVKSLMDDRTWVSRLILSAVILAVLGLVISSKATP
jgi:hypothetical protein